MPSPSFTLRLRGFLFTALVVALMLLLLLLLQPPQMVTYLIEGLGAFLLIGLSVWAYFQPRFRDLAIGALVFWALALVPILLVWAQVLLTGDLMQ